MKIYNSTLTIEGFHLKGGNPLPMFRDRQKDKQVIDDSKLTEEAREKLGYEIGFRILPYNIQDRYDRERKEIELKTVVIENECLRATFLCEYGARLYSIIDIKTGRELLFRNEVFQLANLANRNAWFSGGIEWNVGHYGHMFQTCEPLFFAKVRDTDGSYFLRVYEFERTKRIYYQIDFRLPHNSKKLNAYVRIINDDNFSKPIYWWTNIAVEENRDIRVFSNTSHVVFIYPDSIGPQGETIKKFGAATLPNIETIENLDASYPLNSPYSNEYFFQVAKNTKSPFESAVYNDGFMFFERSTMPLRYRKMFCWCNLKGGRKWQSFLSKDGSGEYIEIQAGLSPTQVNGLDMEANSSIEFLQVFSYDILSDDDTKKCYNNDYEKSRSFVESVVDKNISSLSVEESFNIYKKSADNKIESIIHYGRGFGALEEIRRENREGCVCEKYVANVKNFSTNITTPSGFSFPRTSITENEMTWFNLLKNGELKDSDNITTFMTDIYFKELLEKSIEKKQSATSLIHLGIIYYEEFREDEAVKMWQDSIKIKQTPLAYRNIAYYYRDKKDFVKALEYMEKCFSIYDKELDRAYYEEYFYLLVENKEYSKLIQVYNSLSVLLQNEERIKIYLASAYLYLEEYTKLEDIFKINQVLLREGENILLDLYFIYQAKILAKKNGVDYSSEMLDKVRKEIKVPDNLEFRMVVK